MKVSLEKDEGCVNEKISYVYIIFIILIHNSRWYILFFSSDVIFLSEYVFSFFSGLSLPDNTAGR